MRESGREWFTEWFDSPYYHILYKHRDDNEAEVFMDNLADYLAIKDGEKILDLPCGKGRHSIYLNKKGFDVTGADLSENSISLASKFSNEKLHFDIQDMREPLEQKYDYILNLFTSFGYFESDEENVNVLKNMKKALNENGRLVIDFMNTPRIINNLVDSEDKVIGGITFTIRKFIRDNTIIKEISFEAESTSFRFEEQVKALTDHDFFRYFEQAGLQLVQMFGNYDLDEYNSLTSERMIFVLS